jgi:hypothetical protein
MITAVLAVLALLVVPLATIIATGTCQRELAQAATQAAQQTIVTAVLVTDAEAQHATSELGAALEPAALASWPLPNGQQRTASLRVGAGRRTGDRVPIWIDRQGNRVDPPQTPGILLANAAMAGVVLIVGAWVLLAALWWAACRVLGRINAAWWERQWARTGPQWSPRTWQ